MAHAAANLTYIIHEASESEQQHMFPHDACGLEIQQHRDSTPLSSDGKFSLSSRTQNGFHGRAQGAPCLLVVVGTTEIIYTDISLRTLHLKWVHWEMGGQKNSYSITPVSHVSRISSLTVEDVLCVIGPDPVVRVMTNRGRSQGRVAGHDVKAAL